MASARRSSISQSVESAFRRLSVEIVDSSVGASVADAATALAAGGATIAS
jgi:hypothetical protein